MIQKYVIRDFHPLVFFYLLSFILIILGSILSIRMFVLIFETGLVPPINALAVFFSFIVGVQMLLFAMWFDMDSNKHLR